jgi:UDP-glucose 4-epimerase
VQWSSSAEPVWREERVALERKCRMRILVTGHLGYIGAEMVPILLEHGHDVVGLDTGFYDECDFVVAPVTVPELRMDLRDVESRISKASMRSCISQRYLTIHSAISTRV